MSSERLEVVRRLREAWCRFVPDEIVAFYSLDAEIVPPTGEVFGRIYRGHEGLRRYISEFAATFESPSFEVEEVIDAAVCGRDRSGLGPRAAQRRRGPPAYRQRLQLPRRVVFKHVIYLGRHEALAAAGVVTSSDETAGQARQRRPKGGRSFAGRS